MNGFFEYLNDFHPTIKFAIGKPFNKIDFYGVIFPKNSNKLSTDLYTRETDSHQHLHAKPYHRSCIKGAISYGQAICIKRIWSDEKVFNEKVTQLETWL